MEATTLEVIQEKLKKLQAQADLLIAKKAQSALDQISRLMLEHGLTTEDIEENAKARREAKGDSGLGIVTKRKASNALGTKVAPKFRDLKSGATWTGRGSAPAWIAKRKDRTRFLIQGDAVAAHAASPDAENANATLQRNLADTERDLSRLSIATASRVQHGAAKDAHLHGLQTSEIAPNS